MATLSTAVSFGEGVVQFLDQTLLPHREKYELTADYRRVIRAIKALEIRGAPLIGIAGAYAAALAAREFAGDAPNEFAPKFARACDEIAAARPTAVNLAWAVRRVAAEAAALAPPEAYARIVAAATALHRDDAERCAAIGVHGCELLPDNAVVLTHCNAGFLATGGIGTAIGIIAEAHRRGRIAHVYADETRPILQGARLTIWELKKLGVPCTLLTDSSAAMLMRSRRIDAVITGADRIAANGDAANKIGTYGLAIAARYHNVPFIVAAPLSTVDDAAATGDDIPIEFRAPEEVTHFAGRPVAPEGTDAFAPAFDVTPAALITAIVTEKGARRIEN